MSENMDGGVYAKGRIVWVRAKQTETGITMGGPVAQCDTAKQAAAIAEAFSENVRLTAENARLRSVVSYVDTWVSNPVSSYSVMALDGLFLLTRDRIAALEATDDPC